MNATGVSLSSPIEEKIAWAQYYHQKFGVQLLKDESILILKAGLEDAIHASHRAMEDAGVVGMCRECEELEGGSCCGAGLENRYDGWLLVINLLLGVELPQERRDPGSCFFLGKAGCLLKARPVICVNYLCEKITHRIDPLKIKIPQEREGVELNTLFLLTEKLKNVTRCKDEPCK